MQKVLAKKMALESIKKSLVEKQIFKSIFG